MAAQQIFTLVRVKKNGRYHRQRPSTPQYTRCGLVVHALAGHADVTLAGVGKIETDPNRFLCERCFTPRLRQEAFKTHLASLDPAALLREAGQDRRDFGRTLVDNSGPPDVYLVWSNGEVWEWTAPGYPLGDPRVDGRRMLGQIMEQAWGSGAQPVMGPDVTRPFPKPRSLGLSHYRLAYRDVAGDTHLVRGVLAYRYWNTGICSVVVVAKEGGAADWGAYIGALPNVKTGGNAITGPWVSEEEVVAHVIREGNKLTPGEAHAFFGPGGIGVRGDRSLPMEAYRP